MSNPKVKIKNTKNLSNDWYKLDKVTFDFQTKDGNWQEQIRESYDRGDGACILLYNSNEQKVVLTKQFRLPSYLKKLVIKLQNQNRFLFCIQHLVQLLKKYIILLLNIPMI